MPTNSELKNVVFGRCISRRMPIARWVETGVEGSTLAIRLQRPFVMLRDIPKKIKQYYVAVLKYDTYQIVCMI